MRNLKAFTLAEILVTLAIVGIVAALTIPSLINEITDAQLAAKWKKTFAELSDATIRITMNGSEIDTSSHTNLRDDYAEVMNFIVTDDFRVLLGSGITYKYYKGNSFWDASAGANWAAVRLPNGAIVAFYRYSTTCDYTSILAYGGGTLTGICAELEVDVNGADPPNTVGKDYFMGWLIKKSSAYVLVPAGANNDGTSCVAGGNTWKTSLGCSKYAFQGDVLP